MTTAALMRQTPIDIYRSLQEKLAYDGAPPDVSRFFAEMEQEIINEAAEEVVAAYAED